jgi:hypothetical protein
LATISGAASVSAMNPRMALVEGDEVRVRLG